MEMAFCVAAPARASPPGFAQGGGARSPPCSMMQARIKLRISNLLGFSN
jgi:hypothetical protein